jgi:hypothetical protein
MGKFDSGVAVVHGLFDVHYEAANVHEVKWEGELKLFKPI